MTASRKHHRGAVISRVLAAAVIAGLSGFPAAAGELDDLKRQLEELSRRLERLERQRDEPVATAIPATAAPAPVEAGPVLAGGRLHVTGRCTGLRVGNETRQWREGELLIFDDSFEHEARNPTGELRIILLFDIWRPELGEDERAGISAIFESIDRFRGVPEG